MGVAHSCRDACAAEDVPPQIIVTEQVTADPEPQQPQQPQHEKAIELPVEPDQEIRVTQGRDSKTRRSLLLERKLHTDTEIMRGASWRAHCKLRAS